MTETPLDRAHAMMEAAPEDPGTRLAFYDMLAGAELFLLLEGEAQGDQITPRLFPAEGAQVVLVFDTEDRLADLAGAAPYAGLTGRQLVKLLAGQGIGLGLNLGVAPSSFLLDAAGIAWLAETLGTQATRVEEAPEEVFAPAGLPDALLVSLDAKLVSCAGLASGAYLSGVQYRGGVRSHMLAFIDPVPGAEDSLASAISETLALSGIEAGALDVMFLEASDPMAARLARCALRFDLPQAEKSDGPKAPGMDPDTPPRLR